MSVGMTVDERGTGPAVLLLHGTPSPARDWEPLAARLAPSVRVIIPDLPGYGASPAPDDAAMEAVGDAIAAMLAARGVHARSSASRPVRTARSISCCASGSRRT